jgi:Domain of unknown function (DUF4136)
MSKTLKLWGVFSVFVILLAGCGSTAHIEKDDNTDFSQYRSFAWVDKDGEAGNDQNKSNDLTETRIRKAVSAELEKAGWKESKNRPDVLISYDVLVERSVKETNSPVYTRPFTRVFYNPYTRRYSTIYYPSEFAGYERDQRAVREGTVTITMVDARRDKTIWQGWTTDEVRSRNLTSKEIQYAVRSIFKKFDVAKN